MINLVDMDYADTDPVDIAYDVISRLSGGSVAAMACVITS